MTNTPQAMDYEIVKSEIDGDFEVWTPDVTGGCIGAGKTREAAIKNAVATLGLTVADLMELIQ